MKCVVYQDVQIFISSLKKIFDLKVLILAINKEMR